MNIIDGVLGSEIPKFLRNLIIAATALLIGYVVKVIFWQVLKASTKIWDSFGVKSISKRQNKPITFFFPLLFLNISLGFMELNPNFRYEFKRVIGILMAIVFAFVLINFMKVLEDYFYHRFDLTKENNLKERKLKTQLQFIRKFVISLIIFFTVAIILLSFESMRKIGAGLLTGVGVGGIIIGFAAQKSLGSLLAGFQIAFTQPIRIDDVLIVEGEWGRVEEITLTYVVVNIWDQRRLILPITYFIEKPFQNWTRVSSDLLCTVFLNLDYSIPIPPLRDEFTRLLKSNELWDQKVNVVQVTDNKDALVEVRFLMSARNSSQAFDLRCYIRENMIAFIRDNYPEGLPRSRVEFQRRP
jgi:small-conductance mechanosensitive channel